jgi:hypothetical protein
VKGKGRGMFRVLEGICLEGIKNGKHQSGSPASWSRLQSEAFEYEGVYQPRRSGILCDRIINMMCKLGMSEGN